MRFHELRRILQHVVLVGLAACTDGGTVPDGNCSTTSHEDITIAEPAAPPMQLRIESCRVDVGACPDLCTAALQEHNVAGFASSCTVTFDSTHAYVSADLSSGCAIAGTL